MKTPAYDMSGKVALITGAGKGSGIGFAIAKGLYEAGAKVIISDVCKDIGADDYVRIGTVEELKGLAVEIDGMGLVMDVTDPAAIENGASEIKKEFGHLDFLVNNAGAAPSPWLLQYMELDMWKKTMDVNINGTLLVTRAMLPLMTVDGAAIVNTASIAGKRARPFGGAYCVSKAGVIMMTKVFAQELAALGIRVNAICPGYVMTDLEMWKLQLKSKVFERDFEDVKGEEEGEVPIKRLGTPDEVANTVIFLLSHHARYITGQAVNIDGGLIMEL